MPSETVPTTATPPLSRRERERLMRRQAMLDAARAVFAEKGYMQATVDEIAQRAEFGKGTLYNYFSGGKEDILLAIFDELYDDLLDLIRHTFTPEQLDQQPIRRLFERFITDCFRFFHENEDLFKILMKEAHRMIFSDDPDKVAYFQRQQERVIAALVPPLERAMQRGELRRLPPPAVADMIMGNIKGCQMHRMLKPESPETCAPDSSPEGMADFVTTMLFDGLLTEHARSSESSQTT